GQGVGGAEAAAEGPARDAFGTRKVDDGGTGVEDQVLDQAAGRVGGVQGGAVLVGVELQGAAGGGGRAGHAGGAGVVGVGTEQQGQASDAATGGEDALLAFGLGGAVDGEGRNRGGGGVRRAAAVEHEIGGNEQEPAAEFARECLGHERVELAGSFGV